MSDLDREQKLEFMRARGKLNLLTSDFMYHYSASRTGQPMGHYVLEWQWLWKISDAQRQELLGKLIEILIPYHVLFNTMEDFQMTKDTTQKLLTLFSITQLTVGLGNPSVQA